MTTAKAENGGDAVRPPIPENYLLVDAVAPVTTALLSQLGKRVVDSGCNLLETRLFGMGREICVILLASGSWDAIAKLENGLTRMQRDDTVTLTMRRTGNRQLPGNTLPYAVEVIAADKPGILFQLSEFFSRRGISVDSLSSSRYKAAQTGAEMFQAQLTIGIPVTSHIAGLRDDFLEFCDTLNLDAILEPVKG